MFVSSPLGDFGEITHRPPQCRHCLSPLRVGWQAGAERRQVVELVPARLRVTEHRAEIICCPTCGKRTKTEFPEGVKGTVQYGASVLARALYLHDHQLLPYQRTAEAMRELFGCALSRGTLATAVRHCAAGLVETELQIKRGLRRASVMHADETGLRVAGRLQYVHVASTARLTLLAGRTRGEGRQLSTTSASRRSTAGRASMTGGSPTPAIRSVGTRSRGAHILREMLYFEELSAETKAWATPLKELLLEMKVEVERVCAEGGKQLADERFGELTVRYDKLVAAGLQSPPPPEVPEQVSRQARNLLRRLEPRQEEVWRFVTDSSVPFGRYERQSQR